MNLIAEQETQGVTSQQVKNNGFMCTQGNPREYRHFSNIKNLIRFMNQRLRNEFVKNIETKT